MKSSILLRFSIEFVTYFHAAKFCLNWSSNNRNKEGEIHPPIPRRFFKIGMPRLAENEFHTTKFPDFLCFLRIS